MLNGVQSLCLLDFFVVNDVTKLIFPIRPNLEQNDISDGGVKYFGVVECLIGIVDVFRVDALACFGVVLDFDR